MGTREERDVKNVKKQPNQPEVAPESTKLETKLDSNPVDNVPLKISVVLGTAQITLGKLAALGRGSVIELDTKIGDPLGIYVNGKLIARGDVVIKEDNQTCIQISSIETVR